MLRTIPLILFGALTASVLCRHGRRGIFTPHLPGFAGARVSVDVVIAKLATGSFGPSPAC
jgi:hypothetical protein